MYNEALNHSSAQVTCFLYNCSLNVLCDRLSKNFKRIPKECIKLIKTGVSEVLNKIPQLTEIQNKKIRDLFNPLFNNGFISCLDKIIDLLTQYNIIQHNISEDVFNRIKFMYKIRNAIVHSGRLPDLNDSDRTQSVYYCIAVSVGVVSEICRLILGKFFGFNKNGVGSKSQDTSQLIDFFQNGIWRGSKIDVETFEEWLSRELND